MTYATHWRHFQTPTLIDSIAIMLAIVALTIVAILGSAWWFRASNTKARYLPEWAHSGRIELVVWVLPAFDAWPPDTPVSSKQAIGITPS